MSNTATAEKFDPASNVNLGDNPVEAKKEEGAALLEKHGIANRFYYDPSNRGAYWHCTADGEWMGEASKDFEEYLSDVFNIEATRPKDGRLSEAKRIARHIKSYARLDFVGPIAGFKKGLTINNGKRILVTRDANLIKPTPGNWPTLEELFTQMFGHGSPDEENSGPDQLQYFYGTWKHALECLQNKYSDKRIICLAMAGEAGCGKTLVKKLITRSLGGRECKPYRYMIGAENFSGDLLGSEVWGIDDEAGADTSMKARLKFGGELKMVVAEELYRIRGMMRDGVVLEMFRFPIMCLNREPERLKVLPPLDDDIADKISVLLAHKHPMPMPADDPNNREFFWKTMTAELPHFIHWLLNDFKVSVPYGRFGVTHFHHPELCGDLFEVSKEQVLYDHIKKTLFRSDDELADWWWDDPASKLRELLVSDGSPLTDKERGYVPQTNHLGRALAAIARQYPDRLWKHQVAGQDRWLIVKPGRTIAEYRELQKLNQSFKA
jgi:hypothetical protein